MQAYKERLEKVYALTAVACNEEHPPESFSAAQQPQGIHARQYQKLLSDAESEARKHESKQHLLKRWSEDSAEYQAAARDRKCIDCKTRSLLMWIGYAGQTW